MWQITNFKIKIIKIARLVIRHTQSYLYHKEQINIFKYKNIDFINVVTIPTLSEAKGIALACDESGLEYTMGFILAGNGKLLDGSPLFEAINKIDNETAGLVM